MGRVYRLGFKTIVVLASVMLLAGAAGAYAAFDLVGTGHVSVIAPTEAAAFLSGSVGNQACSVGAGGSSLSCPELNLQQGNTTSLTFAIKNTGSAEENLDIQVTPANSSVIFASLVSGSSSVLEPGGVGTYTYALYGESTGTTGFTINVTPAPLPPQSES